MKNLDPLEIDIDKLREKLAKTEDRASTMAIVAEAIGRLCYLRHSGFCFTDCAGHVVCDLTGLKMVPWRDLPEALREGLCP